MFATHNLARRSFTTFYRQRRQFNHDERRHFRRYRPHRHIVHDTDIHEDSNDDNGLRNSLLFLGTTAVALFILGSGASHIAETNRYMEMAEEDLRRAMEAEMMTEEEKDAQILDWKDSIFKSPPASSCSSPSAREEGQ